MSEDGPPYRYLGHGRRMEGVWVALLPLTIIAMVIAALVLA